MNIDTCHWNWLIFTLYFRIIALLHVSWLFRWKLLDLLLLSFFAPLLNIGATMECLMARVRYRLSSLFTKKNCPLFPILVPEPWQHLTDIEGYDVQHRGQHDACNVRYASNGHCRRESLLGAPLACPVEDRLQDGRLPCYWLATLKLECRP